MSNFPTSFDDDISLPPINDNIQDLGGEAINALRDAVYNTEQYLGLGGAGTTGSISNRIGVSIDAAGNIKSSAITNLGLVVLPITTNQISDSAEIPESKLKLDHRTQDLFNYIQDLSKNINISIGWINTTGIQLQPHINGLLYRHTLNQIDVSTSSIKFLKNKFNILRNNVNSYELINDINNELLNHHFADGAQDINSQSITTIGGSIFPSNYGHTASGIYLNTNRFSSIPQTITDLQKFANFIDDSSIFLYGTRIQNLYTNGISKVSRSADLNIDGYGSSIIGETPAIAYLLNNGGGSSPIDDINNGDDIIEFKPSSADLSSNSFDEKFALVKIGDIARVNYGGVEAQFIIKEKKYIQNGGNKKFIVRINGKNLEHATNAVASINKPLFNKNKYGVLAIALANNEFLETPSLIIGSPRGAQAIGIGFNPDQLNETHYLLYLTIYQSGDIGSGINLPSIDVTGNRGATPGVYTLDSIIESTNLAFRKVGYNYRFIAFSYNGEFGIMLADSYNNVSFSILNAIVASNGTYDQVNTNINFQNNVIDVFSTFDPLGFGISGSNLASPTFLTSYGSAEAALLPTKLFLPLKRNNYYINGIEREKLTLEYGQILDKYGDGYWIGSIQSKNIFPGPIPSGRVQATYRVPLDLSNTNLKIGMTIIVQSLGNGTIIDYGRFIIQSITFHTTATIYTDITVYDAVHGQAISPVDTLDINNKIAIYFNSDSVSFNKENSTDTIFVSPFKRHFEILIDQNGKTFTHERGRINASSSTIIINGSVSLFTYSELNKLNIIKISSKLRGYQFGSVNKITLNIIDYNDNTGLYNGYLSSYDGAVSTHKGILTFGKKGQITRFYDETNIDYIDIIFDINVAVSNFSNKVIDFQLFPTLSLDEEIMLIGLCQLNDVTNNLSHLVDERQFGNTSEKDLSTSALDLISLPERILHSNGVIRGFDLQNISPNPDNNKIYLTGGLCLVNGKFIQMNDGVVYIPIIKENFVTLFNINWAICINDKNEYQVIPLLDYDPNFGTPNFKDRVFHAFNVLTGITYYLDSTTFSNIINDRKDLTLLYIVSSTVVIGSPSTISLSTSDARKYINDSDTNLPLKLTLGDSQGNFKNPQAILNWIKYNNQFNSYAIVKGSDATSGIINSPLTLDFNSTTTIDGENNALLTINSPIIIGSNLTLKNLNIIFNNAITIDSNINNLLIENCDITINVPISPPINNIIFNISGSNNIIIRDCNIHVQFTSLFDGSSIFRGSVFKITNTNDFKIENVDMDVNYNISAGVITPGNIFTILDSNKIIITNSNFSGNFNKFIDITSSNYLKLSNLEITSTYNPNAGGTSDSYNGISYDTSNLVNSGQGYIYSNVIDKLDGIYINNVIFNYSPSINSNDRYSFINFELSASSSIISNLNITNCKFNNTNVSGLKEDLRAAISIINTATSTDALKSQPTLQNANISNNSCNKNQSIIITSVAIINKMVFPGLVAVNCKIDNNICGTIGYWISSETKIIGIPPNVNSLNDKTSGLSIYGNTCHFIGTLTNTGSYFLVSKISSGSSINQSDYPSGIVSINNNKSNWIHVGISYEEDSRLHIKDNDLCSYDDNYLVSFDDTLPNAIYNPSVSTLGISNNYAIFVGANKYLASTSQTPKESNDSSVIISGNTTSAGYWIETSAVKFTYRYTLGYIYCQSSCVIANNILKGVGETFNFGSLILVSGLNNHINNNKIYRENNSIFAYVTFANFELPAHWDGDKSSGIIVNNFFDSPYINDFTKNENVINLTVTSINAIKWIIEKNKNQTGYLTIPITNSNLKLINATGYQSFDSNNLYISNAPGIGASGIAGYKSLVIKIHDHSTVTERYFGWQENIDKYMPSGARIILLKMGVRPFDSIVETPINPSSGFDSNVNLFLNKYILSKDYTNLDYFVDASTSPDSNIVNDLVPLKSVITGGELNSTSNTLYCSIDTTLDGPSGTDISDQFIAGNGYAFSVSVDFRFKRQNIIDMYLSPIMVKYRW